MNFELGKSYIVDVTEKEIIPLMEFDRSQWFNKDYDDLEFLTDKEKEVVVKDVLDKIRAEILEEKRKNTNMGYDKIFELCILIIDKYTEESRKV